MHIGIGAEVTLDHYADFGRGHPASLAETGGRFRNDFASASVTGATALKS